MIMTWTQLGCCLVGFALASIVCGWIKEIRDNTERSKKNEKAEFIACKRLKAMEDRLHDQCNMDEAMQRIEQFQSAVAEIIREGCEVRDCRRCGSNPIDNDNRPNTTIYDGTGYYRMVCECHPRATSNWGECAAEVLVSWNNHQQEDGCLVGEGLQEWHHARDIYEMLAAEHPAMPICGSCCEDCWLIQFGEERMETFHIKNGCDNHQESNGWHRTLEAAVTAWEEQQEAIRRIEEIAAEERK